MADAGQQLSDEQARQDAVLDALELGHADHERRLQALEDAQAPTDPVDPPDPPTPGVPGTRRFGCNVGFEHGKDWTPDKPTLPGYEDALKPVARTLRFMDWWDTNDDLNAGGGITDAQKAMLDEQIDLCNRLGSHMYLCLLFHDSGDIINYKINRVKQRLNPNLTLYVEWANEPWNGKSTNVARELIRLAGGAELGEDAFFDAWAKQVNNAYIVVKYAMPEAVTLLGCLTANPWVTKQLHKPGRVNPAYLDGHALTFYFGSGLGGTPNPGTTVDQILASADAKITDKEIPRIQEHAAYSKSLGLRVVGYEGGPHFTIDPKLHTSHANVWRNMNQANRDPRIVPLCDRVARAAEAAGYEQLCWYTYLSLYDQWGSWGLGEDLNTIETNPKYRYAAGVA